MNNISNDDLIIAVITGTLLFFLLSTFNIAFYLLFQQKKITFKQEKAALKAQYEQEILSSQNEIQEETMKYISRELHDNVVQMLVLTKLQLNNLDENTANQKIDNSKEYLNNAISDLRNLSKILNTENILQEGLANTIRFELNRIQKTNELEIEFKDKTEQIQLDKNNEIVVFRIFQELLQNIIKHACAKKIEVLLQETNNSLILEVQDDGIGFDFEKTLTATKGFASGSGLSNMVYRAKLLNGSLVVKGLEQGGTRSCLTIPFQLKHENSSPH